MKSFRYRGMSVSKGVEAIESRYTYDEIKNIKCFADLHEIRDANMTLPFPSDCGQSGWLNFVNTVIEEFDLRVQQNRR